jgi:hypothetical protein
VTEKSGAIVYSEILMFVEKMPQKEIQHHNGLADKLSILMFNNPW